MAARDILAHLVLLVIALVVLLAAKGADAIVCQPDTCSLVRCDTTITAETCKGRFDPKGGFCRCCPACIRIIPPGGACLEAIRGVPPSAECERNYLCIDGTCQPLASYGSYGTYGTSG